MATRKKTLESALNSFLKKAKQHHGIVPTESVLIRVFQQLISEKIEAMTRMAFADLSIYDLCAMVEILAGRQKVEEGANPAHPEGH